MLEHLAFTYNKPFFKVPEYDQNITIHRITVTLDAEYIHYLLQYKYRKI